MQYILLLTIVAVTIAYTSAANIPPWMSIQDINIGEPLEEVTPCPSPVPKMNIRTPTTTNHESDDDGNPPQSDKNSATSRALFGSAMGAIIAIIILF